MRCADEPEKVSAREVRRQLALNRLIKARATLERLERIVELEDKGFRVSN
jgi:hypothetical protein